MNNSVSKKKLLEEVYHLAFLYEQEYRYCSQCTVAALQKVFQIKSTELFSASYGLAGGFINTCEGTCGALSGGAMIISYFYFTSFLWKNNNWRNYMKVR